MTSMKQNINVAAVAGAVALATALWSAPTLAADAILSGQVKRPDGKPLEGVTISAKAQGSSITTSVFTDMDGYYYLPALPGGQYRLRAQAVIFGTQTAIVDANGKKNQDFALAPLTDFVRQLSGADLLAAMPQDTPEDAAMHRILRSQCVACHSASYVLQHRFDEDGWSKILTLMKGVNVYGMKVERPVQAVIDLNQKQLADEVRQATAAPDGGDCARRLPRIRCSDQSRGWTARQDDDQRWVRVVARYTFRDWVHGA